MNQKKEVIVYTLSYYLKILRYIVYKADKIERFGVKRMKPNEVKRIDLSKFNFINEWFKSRGSYQEREYRGHSTRLIQYPIIILQESSNRIPILIKLEELSRVIF